MAVPGEAGNRTEMQVSLLHQGIDRSSKRLVCRVGRESNCTPFSLHICRILSSDSFSPTVIALPNRLIPFVSAQWAQILSSGHLTSSLCPSIPQSNCCILCLLISNWLSVYCLHSQHFWAQLYLKLFLKCPLLSYLVFSQVFCFVFVCF